MAERSVTGAAERRSSTTRQRVEASERRLVDAVARGDALEALLARLRDEQERKRATDRPSWAALGAHRPAPARTTALAERRAVAADMKATLVQNTPEARRLLTKLVRGRLECEPVIVDGRRGYRFVGRGTYEALVPARLAPVMVVTPAGSDRIWTPEFQGVVETR